MTADRVPSRHDDATDDVEGHGRNLPRDDDATDDVQGHGRNSPVDDAGDDGSPTAG
jgi:hypothetical protein